MYQELFDGPTVSHVAFTVATNLIELSLKKKKKKKKKLGRTWPQKIAVDTNKTQAQANEAIIPFSTALPALAAISSIQNGTIALSTCVVGENLSPLTFDRASWQTH